MSAWYVFSMMGFYPFDPCGTRYVLGDAQLAEVRVKTPAGRTFTVKRGAGEPTLDGRALAAPSIDHADILSGATLSFE